MRRRSIIPFLALLLVVGVAATSCGDDDSSDSADRGATSSTRASATEGNERWAEIVKAAEGEGTVVMYSSKTEGDIARLLDGFHQEYPNIDTEFIRLQSLPMTERIDQELQAGRLGVDVALQAEVPWANDHAARGNVVKPVGPNAADWDESWFEAGVVEAGIDVIGGMYNTTAFDEPPEQWEDFITREHVGRIGRQEIVGTLTSALYSFYNEVLGEDFLQKMSEAQTVPHSSVATLAQAVASGELDGSLYGFAWAVKDLADAGAPIAFALPDDAVGFYQVATAFKQAPHPNAALVLLDYIMSPAGQEIMNGDQLGISHLDLDSDIDLGETTLWYPSEDEWAPSTQDEMRALYAKYFGS